MKRTFVSRDLQLWKTIYTTYIRPHIEFANSVWNPHLRKDIEMLEHVQRSATKVPHATRHLQYTERLKLFNITTLEERRTRDLIQKYTLHKDLKLSTGPYHPLFTRIDREGEAIILEAFNPPSLRNRHSRVRVRTNAPSPSCHGEQSRIRSFHRYWPIAAYDTATTT